MRALVAVSLLSCTACGTASVGPSDGGLTLDAGSDAVLSIDAPVEALAAVDAADASGGDAVAHSDAASGEHVKWHPGHYGETFGPILGYGAPINTAEMATLNGKPAIVGYKSLIYWAALDLGPVTFAASVGGSTSGTLSAAATRGAGGGGQALSDGTYWFAFSDGSYRKVTLHGTSSTWGGALAAGTITSAYVYQFSQVDEHLAYLETKLDSPRHYALTVLPGSFGSTTLGRYVLPNYILTDPAMGPSPTPGSYGWWGGSGNGHTSAAALHRSAVNDRWVALAEALGAYYDKEPYFEAFMVQEDSWAEGALSTNGCPDYSNAPYLASMRAFLTAAVSAFPHTNVVQQNSWVGTATDAQQLADWMTQHRVAPANADTWGQSYIQAHGAAGALPWGVAAYVGVLSPGSSWSPAYDMRPKIRYMPDVEAPDMGLYGGISGSPFTPADLMGALNDTLESSHVFWTMIPDGFAGIQPPNDNGAVWWTNLSAFLAAHPLTHTAYPEVYP